MIVWSWAKYYIVREEALKLWIASSASTVGVTTFLGVLEGGAMHYFVSKKGGQTKNVGFSSEHIGTFTDPPTNQQILIYFLAPKLYLLIKSKSID